MNYSACKYLIIESLFSFLLLFWGCSSGGSVYNNDYPLSNNFAYSPDSTFSILVPQDWFQINDNECNCNNILLISNDYKASITLLPILLDGVTSNNIRKNPLNELVLLNKATKRSKIDTNFSILDEEKFKVGLTNVVAFRYSDKMNLPQRTLVFEKQKKYFEVETIITDRAIENDQSGNRFYRIQNSILNSFLIRN